MKTVGGNGDYRLRRASRTDAPAVETLFSELLRSLGEASAGGYESGYLERFFTGGEDWICLAETAAGVVGYLSIEVHREAKTFLYLDDFCVTETWRNRGVGSALLAAAETYAREKGVEAICLHVDRANEKARRLYERRGYAVDEAQGERFRMLRKIGEQ